MKNIEPAFPQSVAIGPAGDVAYSHPEGIEGLTKREYFAAKAMQGQLEFLYKSDVEYVVMEELAKNSIQIADALIKELAKVKND